VIVSWEDRESEIVRCITHWKPVLLELIRSFQIAFLRFTIRLHLNLAAIGA